VSSTNPAVTRRRGVLRGGARGLRERTSTTPGRLWTMSLVLAGVSGLLWLAGSSTVVTAQTKVDQIGNRSGPAVIDAQKIHESLSDADRSAANAFLSTGAQSSVPRQRYERDIALATHALEQAAEHNTAGSQASDDLQAVNAAVVQYTGLVEAARANGRQGFPVGASYLRAASRLMHQPGDGILARVDALASVNSGNAAGQYASLWYVAALLAVFFAFGALLFALLVSTQRYVRQRFRRRRNNRLVVATLLLVLLSGAMAAQGLYTYRNLQTAEEQAFPGLQKLWQSRATVADINGNESLSLIARGNGSAFDEAFKAETLQLADRPLTDAIVDDASRGQVHFKGLLADEINQAGFPGERAAAVRALRAYQQFLETDAAVRARAATGDHDGAVALALGSSPGQLGAAFADLDAALGAAIDIDQREFDQAITQATPNVALNVAIPFCAVGIALLALWGLQPRIAEYRS
jgi:hypothetical protein